MSDPATAGWGEARPIVGRLRELDVFTVAFDRLLTGARQLLLIGGEPGIGKARCAEAMAAAAEDQGALVLWGRCREESGAPPYWPWIQILRAYIEASSLDEVRLNVGASARGLGALVPELLDPSQQMEPSAAGALANTSAARFRMFDAVRHFFQRATQQVLVALMLYDLHWADTPSLSLLEFLSQEVQRNRLFIVATYRDAAATRRTPLQSTLGALTRNADVQRPLARLKPVYPPAFSRPACSVAAASGAEPLGSSAAGRY